MMTQAVYLGVKVFLWARQVRSENTKVHHVPLVEKQAVNLFFQKEFLACASVSFCLIFSYVVKCNKLPLCLAVDTMLHHCPVWDAGVVLVAARDHSWIWD